MLKYWKAASTYRRLDEGSLTPSRCSIPKSRLKSQWISTCKLSSVIRIITHPYYTYQDAPSIEPTMKRERRLPKGSPSPTLLLELAFPSKWDINMGDQIIEKQSHLFHEPYLLCSSVFTLLLLPVSTGSVRSDLEVINQDKWGATKSVWYDHVKRHSLLLSIKFW